MRLKIAQVIGLNTDQKAAQVTSSLRDDNSFLSVLQITSDDAFTKGRQILSGLEDFYFEAEGNISEKLNATFKEAESKSLKGLEFDLLLAVIAGKVLYLIGRGQVEVYLKRGDKLSPLLSVGAPMQLVSGFLQDGDRLMFSTGSLITFLGPELEKALNLPIDTFEEEVGSKIGAASPVPDGTGQGLAALAVEVTEESPEITPIDQEEQLVEQYSDTQPNNLKNALGKVVGLLKVWIGYFPKSGKARLVVAVILILIIGSGVGYQIKVSRDKKTQAEFNRLMQEAKDAFEGAKGLASLNPADAKTKLDSSKDLVNKALSLKPKSADAGNLKARIESESPSILQQSSVSDFPVFLDLDLIKKNFRAVQMSLSKGKLLLLDPSTKTLVTVDLDKKSNEILAGSEKLGEATFASLNGGLAFVYSGDKGFLKVDTTNSKITTVAKSDKEWGEIKDIYGFAGNVYALDTGKNMIWKYLPAADGYSDKREYLNSNTKADLGAAIRMQIESSIYVLKSGGEILRFTKGEKDNFSFSGLPEGVKDPKSIFTSSDTENLYVLDSGNSRLVILTKIGAYKGQITGSKFATATDLVVDELDKNVYLLEGSKIYSVDLK